MIMKKSFALVQETLTNIISALQGEKNINLQEYIIVQKFLVMFISSRDGKHASKSVGLAEE